MLEAIFKRWFDGNTMKQNKYNPFCARTNRKRLSQSERERGNEEHACSRQDNRACVILPLQLIMSHIEIVCVQLNYISFKCKMNQN